MRVHHFAHGDRKECKQALEASLYGMAIEILSQAGAKVRVPMPFDMPSVCRLSSAGPHQVSHAFTALKLGPEPSTLVLMRPIAGATQLREAKKNSPDITDADQGFALHLLSSTKMLHMIEHMPHEFGDVLALNPLVFAREWYDSVCDPDIEANLKAASRARNQFQRWIAESTDGRGWLTHREEQRAVTLVKKHISETPQPLRQLQPTSQTPQPAYFARAPVQAARRGESRPPPVVPDQVLQADIEKCQRCSSPVDMILSGSGLFAGKKLMVCRLNPKHPMRHLG